MTCRQVASLLSLYLDGELSGPRRREVARHLEGCPTCREEGRSLAQAVLILRAAVSVDPPRDYRRPGKEC